MEFITEVEKSGGERKGTDKFHSGTLFVVPTMDIVVPGQPPQRTASTAIDFHFIDLTGMQFTPGDKYKITIEKL